MHLVQYHGSTHIAFTTIAADDNEVFEKKNRILNSSYDIVAEIKSPDPSLELDQHDFEILDDGKTCVYLAARFHPTGGPDGGGITEAVFQEIDLVSQKVVFEWGSLQHVSPTQTCTSGTPDYFHINSIQKDDLGNYLINGFNICNIYYVDGRTGTILWNLGANSSFTFVDAANNPIDFHLLYTHHVRLVPLSQVNLPHPLATTVSPTTHLALTVYDNAFGGTDAPPTSPVSAALLLLLNLHNHTAQIIERHPHPRAKLAAIFGSVSLLPNGERLLGWGSTQDMSQQTPSGHIKWHAVYGTDEAVIGSYRAFKGRWTGRPNTKPAVYAFAWGCMWPSVAHVSWNGATEVREYVVYGAREEGGPFVEVGRGQKTGFETKVMGERFVAWMRVEARGGEGRVLGWSEVVRTHVPPPIRMRACNEWRCGPNVEVGFHECGLSHAGEGVGDGVGQVVLGD
ncbi:MAG: hypothetical protein Q9195_004617 [Heterodermia aff. obscurata]